MEILEALKALDPSNDEQWTGDGLPKVDVVAGLVGGEVKRADITAAAPDFNRDYAKGPEEAPEVPTPPPEPVVEQKPVEEDAAAPKTPLEQLIAAREKVSAELLEVSRQLSALNEQRKLLENDVHVISKRIDRLTPPNANQDEIMRYIRKGHEISAEKAATRQALQESGIAEVLKSVKKAPIDEAMNTRKPQRGSQRPAVPFRNQ